MGSGRGGGRRRRRVLLCLGLSSLLGLLSLLRRLLLLLLLLLLNILLAILRVLATILLAVAALLGISLAALATLTVLIETLLAAILRIIALLVVLLILWRVATVRLTRLECLGGRLEGGRGRVGSEGAALVLPLLVDVELLLSLSREILVLGGRIVFPRIQVRHRDLVLGGYSMEVRNRRWKPRIEMCSELS